MILFICFFCSLLCKTVISILFNPLTRYSTSTSFCRHPPKYIWYLQQFALHSMLVTQTKDSLPFSRVKDSADSVDITTLLIMLGLDPAQHLMGEGRFPIVPCKCSADEGRPLPNRDHHLLQHPRCLVHEECSAGCV